MKQWKKSICIVAAVLAICVAAVLLFGNRKECCLCNTPASSVPCLIDLETGDILELRLDGPSTTSGPEGQNDVSTFSFIRFGNVTGIKQTAPNVIELSISAADKSQTWGLCRDCRKQLPREYDWRYVLADTENKVVFPIAVGEVTLDGCVVTVTQEENLIHISVQ